MPTKGPSMSPTVYDTDLDGEVESAAATSYDTGAAPPSGTGTDGRRYFDSANNRWYMPRPGALDTWDALN